MPLLLLLVTRLAPQMLLRVQSHAPQALVQGGGAPPSFPRREPRLAACQPIICVRGIRGTGPCMHADAVDQPRQDQHRRLCV